MSYLSMWMVPGSKVNREHNLFVSESKHLFVDAKGDVKYQKKPLDRRTCGGRKILTRLVVLDIDSGALYGEYHDDSTAMQFDDFLLRAWHPKAGHYFRGVPNKLNVPAKIIDSTQNMSLVRSIADPAGVEAYDVLPSGFAAGVHALRGFEQKVMSQLSRNEPLSLHVVQVLSALLSYMATPSAYAQPDGWDNVTALPVAAKQAVQSRYGEDYWCTGPFERIFPPVLRDASDMSCLRTVDLMKLSRPSKSE